MHKLHVVYTALDEQPIDFTTIGVGIASLICCCVLFAIYHPRTPVKIILTEEDRTKLTTILLLGCCIMGFISIITAVSELKVYHRDKAIYNSNGLTFVEGRVSGYHPMPYGGHSDESFYVKGIYFNYSDFEEAIGGYHNAASHGGAIKQNLYVRIGYYPTDYRNIILKLETE